MRITARRCIAGALTLSVALAGCGPYPESCFDLSPTSRLPKWLTLPLETKRDDVAVEMCYFIDANGRTATFAMRNRKTHARLADVAGTVRGSHPLTSTNAEPAPLEYPSYEVITVGAISEVVEHRRMEPVFYVVDDPAIRRGLGVDK